MPASRLVAANPYRAPPRHWRGARRRDGRPGRARGRSDRAPAALRVRKGRRTRSLARSKSRAAARNGRLARAQIRLEVGGTKFAVGRRDRNDFRSAKALERTAFVGLQMCASPARAPLPTAQQRAERGDVCARAVEREIDVRVVAEMLAEAMRRHAPSTGRSHRPPHRRHSRRESPAVSRARWARYYRWRSCDGALSPSC